MGVYARGEFLDFFGDNWRIDIEDTTYTSGIVYSMKIAGSRKLYEGITDDLLFTPAYKSSLNFSILVKESDHQIQALINDIPNGLEDQFYALVYKNNVLWFAGMILTDLSQFDDNQRYIYEFTATDGFNRLENFEFPIDDIATVQCTPIQAIIAAISIAGVGRFFGSTDPYLAISTNWFEIDQITTRTTLENILVYRTSFIEDLETNQPFRALKALEQLFISFGANIRFEDGMWRITQLEQLNSDNITYNLYSKSGVYLSDVTVTNNFKTIAGDNSTNDVMVHQYMPSLNGVAANAVQNSELIWGLGSTIVDDGNWQLANSAVPSDNVTPLNWNCKILVNPEPPTTSIAPLVRVHFKITCGFFTLAVNRTTGEWEWTSSTVNIGGFPYAYIWNDSMPNANYDAYVLDINIPILPFANFTLDGIDVSLVISQGGGAGWIGGTSIMQSLQSKFADDGSNEQDDNYIANNSIYNAASVFKEYDVYYVDPLSSFIRSGMQIFNGTSWVNSTEWASGTTATSGVPLNELVCKKAVFFQRFARNVVQGTFIVKDYSSIQTIKWRGTRYVLLNATYDIVNSSWTGSWVEVLEQTADVVSGPRNPYRNWQRATDYDINQLKKTTGDLRFDLGGVSNDVYLRTIIDLTDEVTLDALQTGRMFSNNGATGKLLLNLPPWQRGCKFEFARVNDWQLTIRADGTDTITLAGEDGADFRADTKGLCSIIAIDEGRWHVQSLTGTWTII